MDPRANPSGYNVTQAFLIKGPVDFNALQQSLALLIERYEALRTGFEMVSREPVQVVYPFAQAAIRISDWCVPSGETLDSAIANEISDEQGIPFKLQFPPLVRCHVLRIKEDRHVFLVTLHYLIADGWSFAILLEELSEIYCALVGGLCVSLRPCALQFLDYASWQWEQVETEIGKRDRNYWLNCLKSTLDFETQSQRVTPVMYPVGKMEASLRPGSASAISSFGRMHGATDFMVYLSAFAEILYAGTEMQELSIGTLVSSRRLTEFERVVGLLVNPLILKLEPPDKQAADGWLGSVRRAVLDALEHQDIPFPVVLPEAGHPPSVFRVLFNMPSFPYSSLNLAGAEIEQIKAEVHNVLPVDLALAVVPHRDGVYLGLRYNPEIIHADEVGSLVSQYSRLLESIESRDHHLCQERV